MRTTLTTALPITGAWSITLLEARKNALEFEPNGIQLTLPAHQIETVEIAFS